MNNDQKPPLIGLVERMNERIKQLHSEGGDNLSGSPLEFDNEIRELHGGAQTDYSRSYPVWLCRKCGELFADEGKFEAHGEGCKSDGNFMLSSDAGAELTAENTSPDTAPFVSNASVECDFILPPAGDGRIRSGGNIMAMTNKRRLTAADPESFLDRAICLVLTQVFYRKGGEYAKCLCEGCVNSVRTKDDLRCRTLGAILGEITQEVVPQPLVVKKGMTCDEAIPRKAKGAKQ